MYKLFMIRTQIYLTPKQHSSLKKKAGLENSTVSEQIRKIIEANEEKSPSEEFNSGAWLLSMAEKAKKMKFKGPKDLASNVDKYLYGRED